MPVLFAFLYFRYPSPHFPLSFWCYLPPVSAFYFIYRSVLPSCGYSTQLCSRQTIWCTLLMTDPTWPRHHLAATARCVCLFLCVWGQVHGDWWWDAVCSSSTKAGGLVTETLTITLTLFHLLSVYCHVELLALFSWISTLNWLLENNEQDVISEETMMKKNRHYNNLVKKSDMTVNHKNKQYPPHSTNHRAAWGMEASASWYPIVDNKSRMRQLGEK